MIEFLLMPVAWGCLIIHEIWWRCRLNIVRRLLGKRLIVQVLNELRTRGVCVLPSYYSNSVVELMRTECQRELDALAPAEGLLEKGLEGDLILENGLSVERYPGSIKIKEPKNPLLNLVCQDRFLMNVVAVFCQKLSSPLAIYHLAHDGSFQHPAVPGTAKVMIAGEAHFDYSYHTLKAFTALEPIQKKNAPFVCLEQSASDLAIVKKRVDNLMCTYKWVRKKNSHCVEDQLLEKLHQRYSSFTATIQPGDLVLFDTCHVHYASELIQGKRSMFWLYY